MRPVPPLIALLALWGLSGLAVLFLGVPAWAWWAAHVSGLAAGMARLAHNAPP